jgi:hypothetical protein
VGICGRRRGGEEMIKGIRILLGLALILIGAASIVVTGLLYFPMWLGKRG